MNTAPARSVIKKKGARPGSLGPVQDRARPNAHVILLKKRGPVPGSVGLVQDRAWPSALVILAWV